MYENDEAGWVATRDVIAERDGWAVFQYAELQRPEVKIHVRGGGWMPAEAEGFAVSLLGIHMPVIRKAAAEGCGWGMASSAHGVPGEELPTVLELLEIGLKHLVPTVTTAEWAAVPAARYAQTGDELRRLGMDPAIFWNAVDAAAAE